MKLSGDSQPENKSVWAELSKERAEEEEPTQKHAQGPTGSQRSVRHQDQGKMVLLMTEASCAKYCREVN